MELKKRQEWKIMGIDKETIQAIKSQAKAIGYTIPQYLEFITVGSKPERPAYDRGKSWLVHGLDKETINKIKDNASKEGKTVANYIKGLLALERTVVRQDRVKAELTKKLKGIVKEVLDKL